MGMQPEEFIDQINRKQMPAFRELFGSFYRYLVLYAMRYVRQQETSKMDVQEVNVNLFLAWKDGRLVFDNCSLENILKDLGKWYDFDVRYEREDARLIPFSLNIKKHDAFAEVLHLLEDTGCVEFDIEDNIVIVK